MHEVQVSEKADSVLARGRLRNKLAEVVGLGDNIVRALRLEVRVERLATGQPYERTTLVFETSGSDRASTTQTVPLHRDNEGVVIAIGDSTELSGEEAAALQMPLDRALRLAYGKLYGEQREAPVVQLDSAFRARLAEVVALLQPGKHVDASTVRNPRVGVFLRPLVGGESEEGAMLTFTTGSTGREAERHTVSISRDGQGVVTAVGKGDRKVKLEPAQSIALQESVNAALASAWADHYAPVLGRDASSSVQGHGSVLGQ